ncbi:MAG: hypothetical protein MUF00_11945 [Gemmatimonadaceae bacterium]|nr:hypothetical protein [Gemmatimonadaceae bacterium]
MSMVAVLAACGGGSARTPVEETVTAVRALPPDTSTVVEPAGLPAGFGAAFRLADTRARQLLYYQQCSAAVLGMRARGRFGAASTAPRAVYCTRTSEGVPLGGVYDIDSSFTAPRRLQLIRLDGAQPRWTQPLDTTRIARAARLVSQARAQFAPRYRVQRGTFTIAPVVLDDGTIEAWALPQQTSLRDVVLGGDMALVRAADGTPARLADRLTTWRRFSVPATGTVVLRSREAQVAAVQELVLARTLAERGRTVQVVTGAAVSALVPGMDPSGSRYTWEHAKP